MRAGLGALRLLPAPSARTAPAPPAGCVPGAAWQCLQPRLAASVPGGPRLHLLSLPESRRAAGGGRDAAVLAWWAAARSRSCLCCCVGCCVVQLEGHRVGEGCGVPSPREKLGQGGIWGRGLGTDWRGRRLRARLGAVPPTAIYTGAPACFLLEMSPPILSPLLPFPVPPFPSVSPAVGLALCLC